MGACHADVDNDGPCAPRPLSFRVQGLGVAILQVCGFLGNVVPVVGSGLRAPHPCWVTTIDLIGASAKSSHIVRACVKADAFDTMAGNHKP